MTKDTIINKLLATHLNREAQLMANLEQLKCQLSDELSQITKLIMEDYLDHFKEDANDKLLAALNYNP